MISVPKIYFFFSGGIICRALRACPTCDLKQKDARAPDSVVRNGIAFAAMRAEFQARFSPVSVGKSKPAADDSVCRPPSPIKTAQSGEQVPKELPPNVQLSLNRERASETETHRPSSRGEKAHKKPEFSASRTSTRRAAIEFIIKNHLGIQLKQKIKIIISFIASPLVGIFGPMNERDKGEQRQKANAAAPASVPTRPDFKSRWSREAKCEERNAEKRKHISKHVSVQNRFGAQCAQRSGREMLKKTSSIDGQTDRNYLFLSR